MNAENAARADSYIIDTYRASKQLDKALAASEDAVKAHPEDKDLKLLHADLLSESGKGAQSIERLQKMLQGSEDDAKIYSAMIQVPPTRNSKTPRRRAYAEKFSEQGGYHFMLGRVRATERV